jgi:hypothetical protein
MPSLKNASEVAANARAARAGRDALNACARPGRWEVAGDGLRFARVCVPAHIYARLNFYLIVFM